MTDPTPPFATFSTQCPYCHTTDTLHIIGGCFTTSGIPLSADGFALNDAHALETFDELIQCQHCRAVFSADVIRL
ncbi:hypothetical protein SAMN00768000_3605 [Sulfobacillus thermosulfidooxidans DSM 9293]|uniref:Uncharacterized protein n=1 Tax=Sulfobacillus thermosulfidooxidans (strain DSM 9293 / VKM B-1269 / AT-1) TaxID=929705 RepID=A0A1W1WNY9_SULTA|nr:hypothetical protein [Sulfobacillus thermosulfidooxidans]SMC08034.1 hypothetical protein SAMN00768000_3605 [Sulfobacillus thermosulfidooxidans DSM 9293]